MKQEPDSKATIGLVGAMSIGIGGIVGGGFFATFGLTIAGAKGATPLSFFIAGLIALATAYSYIGLTLHYSGPGGCLSPYRFWQGTRRGRDQRSARIKLYRHHERLCRRARRLFRALSAAGIASRCRPYHASLAIMVLGFVNFAGSALMERLENFFNIRKLGILALFIVAGFLVGHVQWTRLEPVAWAPASTIVASGMLGFLAYEGFELIANASDHIRDPERTLPIAFLGSVLVAIVIYVLAFIVGIGHLSFAEIAAAKDFAISAAAGSFLGPIGFGIMAIGGVLASASAINADYFGAAKLPPRLASNSELPSAFHNSIHAKNFFSLLTIGVLAPAAVNLVPIDALSAATSGSFLLVYAAVNIAAFMLAGETGANRWLAAVAALLCTMAFVIMLGQFLSDPATLPSGVAIAAVVVIALAIESVYRLVKLKTEPMEKV
jgi:uncharacterized protein